MKTPHIGVYLKTTQRKSKVAANHTGILKIWAHLVAWGFEGKSRSYSQLSSGHSPATNFLAYLRL